MTTSSKMKYLSLLLGMFWAPCAQAVDTAYAPPLGGMTFSIAGGTVLAPSTTWFAIPLQDRPAATGVARGQIAAVTANTITLTNPGWSAGALASGTYPYAVRLTSGTGEGAILAITQNTADTLTVTGRDLVQLGVSIGDSLQLIPIDTLNSLFGSDTFQGGANANDADIITLSSSIQLAYYYNTTLGRWVRTTGPTSDRGGTQISPESVVAVTRKSAAMDLRFLGQVPVCKLNMLVANAGSTYTHTGFPVDVTIGSLAIQNHLTGWVSSATAANADTLAVNSGGTWLYYFHNGSNWQRTTGPATNRDAITISAGTPILLFKIGNASGTSSFNRPMPYSL